MSLFSFLFGGGKEDRDGATPATAIVVRSVAEEYAWVQRKLPGYLLGMQALQEIDGKPFDVLTLRSADGDQRKIYFDISAFFGK